ncbi:MAG: HK97 family phage prohead protease [Devosiaceae bacterium]|nr:HK97 family phage prohead protease [Devosiaceae bacterium]
MSIKATKTARDHGYFCGYASIFGHADKSGDVVMPGAFKRSLKKPGRTNVQLLFQHDPKEPIGKILSVAEDDIGLKVEGLLFPEVERAKSLIALVSGCQ